MGPDVTAALRTRACPSCGASARPEATFCGQCYADFRPPPPPPPVEVVPVPTVPATTASYGVPAGDPLTAPLLDLVLPPPVEQAAEPAPVAGAPAPAVQAVWPCLSCESTNPLSATVCAVCGAGFLAAVADGGKASLVLPVVGDLGSMSRGKRLGIAAGAVAALLVPLALITLLLTGSPPDEAPTGGPGTTTEVVQP